MASKKNTAEKRENGFSVYPDAETIALLDKIAAAQERKRSPMAVIAMKRGLKEIAAEAKIK